MKKGIDVSYYQLNIDWPKVKNNIDFAILRIGFGKYNNQKDTYFERNYNECKRLGIPVGVYHYSYAKSIAEAKEEARLVIKWLENRDLDLPVYFDIEDASQENLGKEYLTNICYAFCEEIEKAGYWAGVYANKYWLTNVLNYQKLQDRFTIWVAQYNINNTYVGKYDIWQNSSSGKIDGINGYVDTNIMYRDLISDVANSKNKQEISYIEYKVKKGDNLTKISKKYNTSIDIIVKDNNINNPNLIYVNQILKIRK